MLVKLSLEFPDLDFDIDFDLASFAHYFCSVLTSGDPFLLCCFSCNSCLAVAVQACMD